MRRDLLQPQKRPRGRPAIGKGEPVHIRLRPELAAAIDAWIAKQDDMPSRPEAIRRLVEAALAADSPPR